MKSLARKTSETHHISLFWKPRNHLASPGKINIEAQRHANYKCSIQCSFEPKKNPLTKKKTKKKTPVLFSYFPMTHIPISFRTHLKLKSLKDSFYSKLINYTKKKK